MKLRVALVVAVVFVALTVAAWTHRFEPVVGATRIGLGDLRMMGEAPAGFRFGREGMQIDALRGQPGAVAFQVPGMANAGHVFVRFHAVADRIEAGEMPWDDGRLFFEWIDDGGVVGVSRIHSARGSEDTASMMVVIPAPKPGVEPVLHFQNLGHAGGFGLRDLEIVAVRERGVWSVGKWFLGCGFLAVVAVLAGGTKKPARWRGWVAALVWMWVAVHYVFPGPWDEARPFILPFSIADVPEAGMREAHLDGSDMPPALTSVRPMEAMPPPSNIGLQIKIRLPWLRPLLHLALLFFPVLAMAWLVGARRAFWLGWGLSLSIEVAQTLYGFGFGWDDVLDLVVNGVAISVAVWAHRKFAVRVHSGLPFPFPEPAMPAVADGSGDEREPPGTVER